MKTYYPPVALVKTWLVISTSRYIALQEEKLRAYNSIHKFFGSITIAELYVEQLEKSVEIIFI